ncbi:MAG: hypothetical protein ACK5OX_01200, partial [Desertimonas sp.]
MIDRLTKPARRVTTIVAGAGYGKSTLLDQASGDRWVIHRATPADASLAHLVAGIERRLRLAVPDLSSEVGRYARQSFGVNAESDEHVAALAGSLCSHLEGRASEPIVLAIDDLHEVGTHGPSVTFIESLCRAAPRGLSVVLVSRNPLPFPVARLRVGGDLLELGAEDLSFELDEVLPLVAHRPDADQHAAGVMRRTRGWPIATMFLLREDRGADHVTDDDLADYVAEEVLRAVPHELRERLTTLAQLPWWTPELLHELSEQGAANELAPGVPTPEVWLGLVGPHPDVPDAVAVPAIVRDHLAPAAARAAMRPLLVAAAGAYARRRAWFEALDCARRAQDPAALTELLHRHGVQMIGAGLRAAVEACLDSLGHPPDLALLAAEVAAMSGNLPRAAAMFETLMPATGPIPAAIAGEAAFVHHLDGDLATALAIYERADLTDADPADAAILLGRWASTHYYLGHHDQTAELATRSADAATRSGDDRALSTAYTALGLAADLEGRANEAGTHIARALAHATEAGDVLQITRLHVINGKRLSDIGELDEAQVVIDNALRLADLIGFNRWRGMALSLRAAVLARRGQLDAAAADLRDARRLLADIAPGLLGHPLTRLARVYATRGDTALAIATYREAAEVLDRVGDHDRLVAALAAWSALVLPDDPDAARELAERAISLGGEATRPTTLLAAARVEIAAGRRTEALRTVTEAVTLATSRDDRVVLAEARELQADLAEDPAEIERLRLRAEAQWRSLGAPID